MTLPNCPECGSEYTYEDRGLLICPECGNEWNKEEQETVIEDGLVVLDANGNRLLEGDSVTVIKDLKVKGASGAIKQGTKVKNIRLVEGDHNIDCKVEGFGPMKLKSEFVERFPELSLFYRLFSPLNSEMICIFPYFCPYAESAREIRGIFVALHINNWFSEPILI